jgi:hypothetical protein
LVPLFFAFAPAPARAGCSHYVSSGIELQIQKSLASLKLLEFSRSAPIAPRRAPC